MAPDRAEEAAAGDLDALAGRLGIDLLPVEQGDVFLRRILPPDAMVFWTADRF